MWGGADGARLASCGFWHRLGIETGRGVAVGAGRMAQVPVPPHQSLSKIHLLAEKSIFLCDKLLMYLLVLVLGECRVLQADLC